MSLSQVGRMVGCNHATVINANKRVQDSLDIMSRDYVEIVNNWAVVFQDIMPNDAGNIVSLEESLELQLQRSMVSAEHKSKILNRLLIKYGDGVVNK